MSCDVCKNIRIAKLFTVYQLEADERELTTVGSEFVTLIFQALALIQKGGKRIWIL